MVAVVIDGPVCCDVLHKHCAKPLGTTISVWAVRKQAFRLPTKTFLVLAAQGPEKQNQVLQDKGPETTRLQAIA